MFSVEMDKEQKILTIKMGIEKPRLSASGKTMLVATTKGLRASGVTYQGHPTFGGFERLLAIGSREEENSQEQIA